jgi:hypothetical protein
MVAFTLVAVGSAIFALAMTSAHVAVSVFTCDFTLGDFTWV